MRPGERFGPGGDAGRGEALLFDLASVTAPQELGPCARYFENGLPTEENSPLFRRSVLGDVDVEFLDNSFGFTAQERDYAGDLTTYNLGSGLIVETGLRLETDYSAPAISGSAGVLPGTMIVTDSWGKGLEPVVVVS